MGANARQAERSCLVVYLVFSCRRARRALSPSGLGSTWLKSNLIASRSATSLGWMPHKVARAATPLSRCVRDTISGQRYEVFDNCKGGVDSQIFVPLPWQACGSAARTISAPARGRFLLCRRKVCAPRHIYLWYEHRRKVCSKGRLLHQSRRIEDSSWALQTCNT